MALTTCAECGHSVSDRAAACPQCGAPIAPGVAKHKPTGVLSGPDANGILDLAMTCPCGWSETLTGTKEKSLRKMGAAASKAHWSAPKRTRAGTLGYVGLVLVLVGVIGANLAKESADSSVATVFGYQRDPDYSLVVLLALVAVLGGLFIVTSIIIWAARRD